MGKFYVKFEEKFTWHGHVIANSLEEASEKSNAMKREDVSQMICIHEPVNSVMLQEDKEAYGILGHITDCILSH